LLLVALALHHTLLAPVRL